MPLYNYMKLDEIFRRAGHYTGKAITKRSKIYPQNLVEGVLEKGKDYIYKLSKQNEDHLKKTLGIDLSLYLYHHIDIVYDFIKEAFIPPKENKRVEDILKRKNKVDFKYVLEAGYEKGYFRNYFIDPQNILQEKDFDYVVKRYYQIKEEENKCINDVDFISQEEVAEIEKNKLIKLPNRQCYDVDYLVGYITANRNLNIDPSDQTKKKKLWENESERLSIVNHPGLDPEIKQGYLDMLKEIQAEEEKFVKEIAESGDKIAFLNSIPVTGSILTNDEASNWSSNESGEEFQTAQIAIQKFLNTLNERNDKEMWLNIKLYGDKSLGNIISSIKDTCIHGIGNSLTEFYLCLYYTITVKYGKRIPLSRILIKRSNNIYFAHQLVTPLRYLKRKPQSWNNIFDVVQYNINEDTVIRDIRRINLRIDGSFLGFEIFGGDINNRINAWTKFNDNYYRNLEELV